MSFRIHASTHPQGSEWETQAVGSGVNSESSTHAINSKFQNDHDAVLYHNNYTHGDLTQENMSSSEFIALPVVVPRRDTGLTISVVAPLRTI
jgi:hypothetical protein